MNRPLVDKLTLCRVLWRSFFLQAAWNYQGQQSLGLAAAMSAALEKIHGRGTEAFNQALADYLEPFNTQPHMSGPILGALVRSEEEVRAGGLDRARVRRYKTAMSAALAAIGDGFFWNALLPAAAAVGLFFAVEGHPAGAVFFLVLFNLAHAPLRIWGFFAGYGQGLGIVSALDKLHLPLAAQRLKVAAAAALGLTAAWSLTRLGENIWREAELLGVGLVAGAAIVVFSRLIKRKLPVEVIIYGLGAVLVAWRYSATGN